MRLTGGFDVGFASNGDTTPSKADFAATKRLREAGDLLGVPLLDHLILGKDGAFASLVGLELE